MLESDSAVVVDGDVAYSEYTGEDQLQGIIDLISVDLSEPYSIFTYRYFINNWPNLCFIATTTGAEPAAAACAAPSTGRVVGTIVCKQDRHRSGSVRGYIAMLAVHNSMRKRGMGKQLVKLAVRAMRDGGCDEAVLETEVTNLGALRLYEGLGFVRDKRLHRYYLNGNDAYRLKLWFHDPVALSMEATDEELLGAANGGDDLDHRLAAADLADAAGERRAEGDEEQQDV